MKIRKTPSGCVPELTREERGLLKRASTLMANVELKLGRVDAANDDMGARAGMVVNDIEEFWDAVREAQ